MKIEVKITDESGNIRQYTVSGSPPSGDVPLMIWANVYNPIKTDSWDLYNTEAAAVVNSIGAKTHCYVHESLLGNKCCSCGYEYKELIIAKDGNLKCKDCAF